MVIYIPLWLSFRNCELYPRNLFVLCKYFTIKRDFFPKNINWLVFVMKMSQHVFVRQELSRRLSTVNEIPVEH
jgi:hypothetical protein